MGSGPQSYGPDSSYGSYAHPIRNPTYDSNLGCSAPSMLGGFDLLDPRFAVGDLMAIRGAPRMILRVSQGQMTMPIENLSGVITRYIHSEWQSRLAFTTGTNHDYYWPMKCELQETRSSSRSALMRFKNTSASRKIDKLLAGGSDGRDHN